LVTLSSAVQIVFMTLRFWFLLPNEVPLSKASQALIFGHLANNFAPARAGEALKIVFLNKGDHSLSLLTATGSFAADKIVDLLSLILLFILFGSYRSSVFHFSLPHWNWWILLLSFLGLSGLVVLGIRKSKIREKIQVSLAKLAFGFNSIKNPKRASLGLLFGVCCWASEVVALHLLCSAQGLSFSTGEIIGVICVLNLGLSLAVSIANLGTFEASMVYALTKLSCPPETALAIAICHHALQLISVVSLASFLAVKNIKTS